jgi:hypothetical protein
MGPDGIPAKRVSPNAESEVPSGHLVSGDRLGESRPECTGRFRRPNPLVHRLLVVSWKIGALHLAQTVMKMRQEETSGGPMRTILMSAALAFAILAPAAALATAVDDAHDALEEQLDQEGVQEANDDINNEGVNEQGDVENGQEGTHEQGEVANGQQGTHEQGDLQNDDAGDKGSSSSNN